MNVIFLSRLVKNINEDVVYSMKCEDLNGVSSVTWEEPGQNPINLVKNLDYEVVSDQSTLFLKITKKMDSQKQHCITIKVLDKDNIGQDWKVFCQPKG